MIWPHDIVTAFIFVRWQDLCNIAFNVSCPAQFTSCHQLYSNGLLIYMCIYIIIVSPGVHEHCFHLNAITNVWMVLLYIFLYNSHCLMVIYYCCKAMLLLLLIYVVLRDLWKIDVYLISTLVNKSLYYYGLKCFTFEMLW